jgi:hypothetical protein
VEILRRRASSVLELEHFRAKRSFFWPPLFVTALRAKATGKISLAGSRGENAIRQKIRAIFRCLDRFFGNLIAASEMRVRAAEAGQRPA